MAGLGALRVGFFRGLFLMLGLCNAENQDNRYHWAVV